MSMLVYDNHNVIFATFFKFFCQIAFCLYAAESLSLPSWLTGRAPVWRASGRGFEPLPG